MYRIQDVLDKGSGMVLLVEVKSFDQHDQLGQLLILDIIFWHVIRLKY